MSRLPSLVTALCVSLTVAGLPAVLASPATTAAAAVAPEAAEDNSSRPDTVSAMLTAQSTGHRVEDESARTESVRVYANPDGTWTSETASEPVSVQDQTTGEWESIDTTLVAFDGGFRTKSAAPDVLLSDGGDKVFAQLTEETRTWTGNGQTPSQFPSWRGRPPPIRTSSPMAISWSPRRQPASLTTLC